MSAPAFSIYATRRTFLPTLPRTWLAAAMLVVLALTIRFAFGTVADVAWMIDCNERWLLGAVPYRDFLEINPPASLMLYWPAVAAARALGVPSEWGVLADQARAAQIIRSGNAAMAKGSSSGERSLGFAHQFSHLGNAVGRRYGPACELDVTDLAADLLRRLAIGLDHADVRELERAVGIDLELAR